MKNIRQEYNIKKFDDQVYYVLKSIKKDNLRIMIQGGYGKNNLGDDALLIILYEKLKGWFPQSDIVAMCHYPRRVEQLYGIPAIGFKSIKTIKGLFWCDVLIIGGGGIVNVVNTYSGLKYLKIFDMKGKFLFLTSFLVKQRRKKVIFYGVGMTSIPDKVVKLFMKITLKRVDLVGVRDQLSYQNIEKYIANEKSLYITYDPALDYKGGYLDKRVDDNHKNGGRVRKIIISTRAVPDVNATNQVIHVIVALINEILKRDDVQIVLLPVSVHPDKEVENDIYICRRIYDEVQVKENQVILVNTYLTPKKIQKMLGEASLILMTRLHGVIVSYDFHIPTVIISYNEKVKLFGEMAGYQYIYDYYNLNKNQVVDIVNQLLDKG